MYTSPGGPLSVQLLTDVTADETLSKWVDVRGYAHIVFYITGSPDTISSGVITIEEAAPKNLSEPGAGAVVFGAGTGGYASITTRNAADVTAGLQTAAHITVAAYCLVRARISTAIGGGGSISVGMVAY